MNDYRTIPALRKRLANAKRRTLFWSGNPSFRIGARAKASQRMSEHYEIAMCDQKSLVQLIVDLGGKAAVRDYRQEFIHRYLAFTERQKCLDSLSRVEKAFEEIGEQ